MATVPFDINALPSNSNSSKEANAREKLKPIINKDDVVVGKKSLGTKLKEAFISEEAKDVKSYIFMDVVIPTIKNTILDIIEMAFFGNVKNRRRSRDSYSSYDRVSYSSYYKSDRDRRRDIYDERPSRPFRDEKLDYKNIVLRNRRDAEEVVSEMIKRIEEYNQASIADLFDLIDVSSSYVDNNWGWTDPRDIGIRRVSSGYLIDVADARYLD